MTTDIAQQLTNLSIVPPQKEAFDAWLQMKDAIAFMKASVNSDEFVVYASAEFTFLHAVLLKSAALNPPDYDDLISWNFNATSSWEIWSTTGDNPSVSISQPMEDTRSKSFNGGEQLVFARYFEGRIGNKNNYEILQKFVHILGLHYMAERNAYCVLNEYGDIEEAIRIDQNPGKNGSSGTTIITIKRNLIDKYAVLTDTVLVCTFDFTRFRLSNFSGWSDGGGVKRFAHDDLIYKLHIQPGYASYMRGVQIIRAQTSKESVAREFSFGEQPNRQYASFIAHDFKNDRIVEISCSPDQTTNYFTKSDLPFELSPAFFRPEVLVRYKSDSEKYQVKERSISCRGAWYLSGYDINEAGQVHAYICDLRDLPYEEQLYWKAHNEAPKGPISKRAFTADFEGSWKMDYDPLVSLKERLREWNRNSFPWWTLRNENLLDQVHYPVTSSADEWANEMLQLDQLVVEGVEKQWLKQQALILGRTPDIKIGSLKFIEECLVGIGFEVEDARQIISPFSELHLLRSKLKGHASGEEAVKIKQETIAKYGNYKKHFRSLCAAIDKELKTLQETFDAHICKKANPGS